MPTELCSPDPSSRLPFHSARSFQLISTGIPFPTEIPAISSERNWRSGHVPISPTSAPVWSCTTTIPAGLRFSSRLILVHFKNERTTPFGRIASVDLNLESIPNRKSHIQLQAEFEVRTLAISPTFAPAWSWSTTLPAKLPYSSAIRILTVARCCRRTNYV
jgi:hypothetical protein